jgi:hypothetical protein
MVYSLYDYFELVGLCMGVCVQVYKIMFVYKIMYDCTVWCAGQRDMRGCRREETLANHRHGGRLCTLFVLL